MNLILSLFLMISFEAYATESLSYSGRLVKSDGSPVTGTPDLRFRLGYSNNPGAYPCVKQVDDVPLSNGVFHVRLNFVAADCTPATSLTELLSGIIDNHNLVVQVSDLTSGKNYDPQAIHSVPSSIISKTLVKPPTGTPAGHVLTWDGAKWTAAASSGGGGGGGSGTLVDLNAGAGISVSALDADTWTVAIANLGVNTAQIAANAVTDAKIASGIARNKLATGTPNQVLVNDNDGNITSITSAAVVSMLSLGGAATANLGYASGNVMPGDAFPTCSPGQYYTSIAGPIFSCSAPSVSVATANIQDGAVTDIKISGTISRSKIAVSSVGDRGKILINDPTTGALSSVGCATGKILSFDANGPICADAPSSSAPSGAASGDLDGTYPSPTIKTVTVAKGGTGLTVLPSKGVLSGNDGGTAIVGTQCTSGKFLSFDADGDPICADAPSGGSGDFADGGNNFAAAASLGTNTNYNLSFRTNNNVRMTIAAAGNVAIGMAPSSEKFEVSGNVKATAFISTSDRRLKKDIKTAPGLTLIRQLRGTEYIWKLDGKRDMGLIAQELEKVLPWAVVTDKISGNKAVKYNSLIAPLIEATNELANKNEDLHDRLKELEEENLMMNHLLRELALRLNNLEKRK